MSEDQNKKQIPMSDTLEPMMIQAMLQDEAFAQQMAEVMDVSYLTQESYKAIVGKQLDLFKSLNGQFPSREVIAAKLIDDIKDQPHLLQPIRAFFNRPIAKDSDLLWARQESLSWCRTQRLMLTLGEIIDMCEQDTIKYESIVKKLHDAVALGSERNFGHVYKDEEDINERFQEGSRSPIETPWEVVNEITQRGLSAGELGVILALTGVGKSHALVDLGVAAAMAGKHIVHFTFELSEVMVGKRYDARISDVPFNELMTRRAEVEKALAGVKGSIHIKKYPNRDASCLTLQNYVNRLTAAGTKPDMLIVDYADIMKSGRSYENKRFEEEAVYEQLRSLADELGIPIWTASQVNRSGMDVEVLTLKHIAECFAKANIADLFITMNRKKSGDYEAMMQGNCETVGNMYIAKSRLGPDGVRFNILVDTARSKIKCLRPGSPDEDRVLAQHDLQLETETSRLRRAVDDVRNKPSGPNLSLVKSQEEKQNEYQR